MSVRQPHELLLAASVQPVTMSSQEIAGLTSKQHQHVKRDIEKMLAELGEDVSKFGRIYRDSMNRPQTEYLLDRELTDTLLTGYSAVLRRKVIARWRELEGAPPAKPAELSRMDLIEMAMAAERERLAADAKVQQLEHQVADQAPAVAGLKLIADASGSMCFRDAAATLNMPQHALTDYLVSKGWIYERAGAEGFKAYRARLQALDLRYNTFGYQSKTTGERKARQQVRITNKGLTRLAEMIAAEAAERKLTAATPQHQHRLGLDPS